MIDDETKLRDLIQPLAPAAQEAVLALFVKRRARERLPDERKSETFTFRIPHPDGEFQMYAHVGIYPDGRPGELFLTTDKAGSFTRGALDAAATALSMALQYGAPLRALLEKWKGMRFPPDGKTADPRYPFVASPLDYLARRLLDFFEGSE